MPIFASNKTALTVSKTNRIDKNQLQIRNLIIKWKNKKRIELFLKWIDIFYTHKNKENFLA